MTLRSRAAVLFAIFALLSAAWAVVPAWSQSEDDSGIRLDDPPAAIAGIQLRKADSRLHLQFLLDGETPVALVGNTRRKVVVIKFQHARAAFPQGQRVFAFNDPLIEGVVFDEVAPNITWAKVRLRESHIGFERLRQQPDGRIVIAFWRTPAPEGPVVMKFRLGQQPDGTRLVFELTELPEYETQREGNSFLIRLRNTTADMENSFSGEDERVQLVALDPEGSDLLVRLQFKQSNLHFESSTLVEPTRLVFNFTGAAPDTTAATPRKTLPDEVPGSLPSPAPRGESLDALLDAEPSPVIRANYVLAEREFRGGRYDSAGSVFMRVYLASPRSRLGIRAFFRASDSQYAMVIGDNGNNFHRVINNYQAAVRAAEKANYESDLIPKAFFQIGRSYQRMDFDFEANIHYQILQERFPDNAPYTQDSYFYRGMTYLAIRKFENAIDSFKSFLNREGDPALIAATHYQLGDTYYSLKRYPESKEFLDSGRRIDPNYPNTRPVLLFHMGETYYENAEFDLARLLYRALLERFPDKSYTKLVALRLGDFLRDEGKETDALEIYRMVVQGAPLAIRLRGKMRIANLLVRKAEGDDYKKGVKLYDEVISEGQQGSIVEEAQLRKALALTLHNQHLRAIKAFETLVENFPDSLFVRPNVIQANIEENLKSQIDANFAVEKYWEVVKTYAAYRDIYFPEFKFNFTLFQIANAYQHLGLNDEAIHLYQRILDSNPGEMKSLIEYRKATAYAEKDDLVQAEESLLRFIQSNSENIYLADARTKLGAVYLSGRRYAEALNAFRILERDFVQNKDPGLNEAAGEIYYSLGVIYKELGQLKDSADAFDAAVENFHHPIQGDNVPQFIVLSHFLKGDALFNLEQEQDAIAAYEQAIELYPNHDKAPWARYQIGLIYRRNGEERKALEVFNELVELARIRPGELWETLARESQRDLVNALQYKDYLKQ